jgi:perosamine synthetase
MSLTRPAREIAPGAQLYGDAIPLATPDIGEAERRLVDESLRSGGWISYGPFVDRFEHELACLLGRRYAVSTSSGTAALHLALIAVGVRPGDEVPMSALSFISPANAIRYVGARPVFIDAEREYRQIDPEKLAAFLGQECEAKDGDVYNRSTGARVGAVVAVDLLGHPADFQAIGEIANDYGLPVVEDAAEALGAQFRNKPAGALADVACLSFNGNKIVTCASGGMVVTDDVRVAEQVRYLATQAKDDPLEGIHCEIGFNYRLSNLHAALGYGQLLRLSEFVESKRRIADAYAQGLGDMPGIEIPREAPWAFSTFWLYTIHIDPETYGIGRRELMARLLAAKIQVRALWQPLHRSPAHAGAQAYECEVADRLHATGISLPSSVALSLEQQARVIAAVREHAS